MTEYSAAELDALRLEYGDDVVPELVQTFLEDAGAQLAAMRAALAANDAEALRRAAHSLKSTCSLMRAGHVATQCQQIEDLAKTGETGTRVTALLARCEKDVAAVCAVLREDGDG